MGHIVTRIDHKVLFTALAFISVATKSKSVIDLNEQVLRLAGLIETFVTENILDATAELSAPASETIDTLIEKYLRELRKVEITVLPSDKPTLVGLYDRLLVRKTRRLQRDFYANATESKLADLVLRLLDEEIEDTGALT